MTDKEERNSLPEGARKDKLLSPAAKRALKEAQARRKQRESSNRPEEIGGPEGAEPTRFGDWERGGIASDF